MSELSRYSYVQAWVGGASMQLKPLLMYWAEDAGKWFPETIMIGEQEQVVLSADATASILSSPACRGAASWNQSSNYRLYWCQFSAPIRRAWVNTVPGPRIRSQNQIGLLPSCRLPPLPCRNLDGPDFPTAKLSCDTANGIIATLKAI